METQHGSQYGAGGALAVGAGDVDELHRPLRMSHLGQQLVDAAQAQAAAPPVHRMDVIQGFIDGHALRLP